MPYFSDADVIEQQRRDRLDTEQAAASKERAEALANENMPIGELMSMTSAQYHRQGQNCPWDCGSCPGNIAADEYEYDHPVTHEIRNRTGQEIIAFVRYGEGETVYQAARRIAQERREVVKVVKIS